MLKTNVVDKYWEIRLRKKNKLMRITTYIKAESEEAAKVKIGELLSEYEIESINETSEDKLRH